MTVSDDIKDKDPAHALDPSPAADEHKTDPFSDEFSANAAGNENNQDASAAKAKHSRFFSIVAAALIALFIAGTGYFTASGVRSYMEDGVRADIVEGLHALEENDLDTASNRFLQVLADHPKEVICADYMAWIEARKGNLDKALQYARASFAVDGHLASYELMGYLALCGRGKAVGAQAALYYFEAALRDVPDSQRESKLRSMLSYSLKLCQKRSDYLLIVDRAAKAGLAEGILLRGDADFLGESAGLSPKSALISWQEARRAGDQRALVRIAMMKWYGYGCERNFSEAKELLGEAVRRNIPEAIFDQALINLRHDDNTTASLGLQLMQKAANLGYGPALTVMGILSLQNDLSRRSRNIAFNYFERAAHHGEYTGTAFYAFMLYTGLGPKAADRTKARAVLYEMRKRNVKCVDGIYSYIAHFDGDDMNIKALNQMAYLCAAQIYGAIYFDDGDPMAVHYSKMASASFYTYYTPMRKDQSLTPEIIKQLEHNYVAKLKDPDDIRIDGEKLYTKDFVKLLCYYNPILGAKPFSPGLIGPIILNAPALPEIYDQYHIEMHRINGWAGIGEPDAWYVNL